MSQLLNDLSEALVATVKSVGQQVVRVEGRERLSTSGVVWSQDGLVVTAHHGVKRDQAVRVGLPDGTTASAKVLGRVPNLDLALLRVDSDKLTPADWAEADQLQVGALVLALGRPGPDVLATLGILSAVETGWRAPTGGHFTHYVQSDVVMYPGFSGGPLVSAHEQALGINTSALVNGLSLSIPTATLRRAVETLLNHGRVRQGYLGLGGQTVRLPNAHQAQVGQETGLLLMMVEPGGPADRGGLLLGDILLSIDNETLKGMDDLLSLLNGQGERVGATVPIRFLRAGQPRDGHITIGERT